MPDLGRKYTCYSCHTKFYDLGKPIPLCPKCGADQRDAEDAPVVSAPRSRRVAVVVEPEPVEEPDFVAEEPSPAAETSEEEEETFVEPEREDEPEEDEEEEEF